MKALGQQHLELIELTRNFPRELRNVTYQQMADDSLSELVDSPIFRERDRQISSLLTSTKGFKEFDLSGFADTAAAFEFARRVFTVIEWVAYDTSNKFPIAPTFQVYPGLPVYVERVPGDRMLLRQSPLQPLYEKFRTALETLDPSRVRLCEACNSVFWALRKDQAACSKPCANRARVRRSYATNSEKIKETKRKARKSAAKSVRRK